MQELSSTRQLLEAYYRRFAEKKGWEDFISDDFSFTGGDMTITTPISGKEGYIQVIKRFSRVFENLHISQMIVEGDQACVVGNYDFKFPNGVSVNGNVAEIWKASNGKLCALTIFFDTLTFQKNTPK